MSSYTAVLREPPRWCLEHHHNGCLLGGSLCVIAGE